MQQIQNIIVQGLVRAFKLTDMKLIILLLLSLPTFGQKLLINGNRFATPVVPKQRIYINLSATDLNVTKYNDFFGAPAASVLSISNLVDTAGTSTGIGISTVATANWVPYGGVPANSSNDAVAGIGTGTFYPGSSATLQVYASNFYQYGNLQPGRFDTTKWQFALTGMDPAKTYQVLITTVDGTFGFYDKGVFRVIGLTSPTAIEVDGDVVNQATGASFILQPKADGTMRIYANTSSTAAGGLADLVFIPAIMIIEQ